VVVNFVEGTEGLDEDRLGLAEMNVSTLVEPYLWVMVLGMKHQSGKIDYEDIADS
jgi:hypothetical protein